jgi:integrase
MTTRRSYKSAISSFIEFSTLFSMPISFPISEIILIHFASHLASRLTHSTIFGYITALRSWHIDNGSIIDTSKMFTLQRVLKGIAKAKGPRSVQRKLPVTTKLLELIKSVLDFNLHDHRLFWTICTIATYGLLRLSEVVPNNHKEKAPIRFSDIAVDLNKCFSISIRFSKTDQIGQGQRIWLAANGSATCPYDALFQLYLKHSAYPITMNDSLFINHLGVVPTRKWVIASLKIAIAKLGFNEAQFSGHSFRRGGTTSLAAAGVPDHLIKHMGRWRSATYQVYVDPGRAAFALASQRMSKSQVLFGGLRPRRERALRAHPFFVG